VPVAPAATGWSGAEFVALGERRAFVRCRRARETTNSRAALPSRRTISRAVVLDLVHPAGPYRRLEGPGGNAGVNEAIGTDAVCRHGGELAACSRSPQPSDCRGT
jgi:hypothetical protein